MSKLNKPPRDYPEREDELNTADWSIKNAKENLDFLDIFDTEDEKYEARKEIMKAVKQAIKERNLLEDDN